MPIANVNGIGIDCRVEGQGSRLVMIAGFSATRNDWRFQRGSFKKLYRTLTFDNRGVGGSEKPVGPYTIEMMADDTIELMNYLGIEKAHILGHSMGGMIAQELAINHPERVDRLVLASTFGWRDGMSGFTSEMAKALEIYSSSPRNESAIRRLYDALVDLALNQRLYRIIAIPQRKIMTRLSDSTALSGLVGQLDAVLGHDAADRLKLIRAPTLVITGTEDRVIKPVSSEAIANRVPKAKLVKVEAGSHAFHLEMRKMFNRIVLGFLRD